MTETLPDPYGKGHDMLVEWGIWTRDDREGGASWSVKPRLDKCTKGEPPDSVVWLDKLIAKHKLRSHNDWRVLAQYYMDDRAIWEVAKRMKWADDRVRGLLLAFCGLVEREWEDSRC